MCLRPQLMKGDAAVQNAQVHAVVARPDGQRVRVKLLDNGLGGRCDRIRRDSILPDPLITETVPEPRE